MKKWWEKYPERLEYELESLRKASIPFERDEDAFKRDTIILKLRPTIEGREIKLEAVFPDFYPYMRFEVIAPELNLQHHQNPFLKNLCLIGRSTANWKTTDTLADFIIKRLPKVIFTGNNDDKSAVSEIEEHQGEPITSYYPYVNNSVIFIDSAWKLDPSITEGTFQIGININNDSINGAILLIKDKNGNDLLKANPEWNNLFQYDITCRWLRSKHQILEFIPDAFMEIVTSQNARIGNPEWKHVGGHMFDIVGVVFPEEVAWRHNKDGWIFVIRLGKEKKHKVKKRIQTRITIRNGFIRSGRAGRVDLSARVPELANLCDKKIAVVGLGCLGAPSVIEFARCGIGELRILDHDIIDAGTIVRWPFGLKHIGKSKVEVLKVFIDKNYPYTKTVGFKHRIGEVSYRDRREGENDLAVLDNILDDVDLLYDASAEFGLQHLLSELAAERQIPYICISTTPGAWGGRIIRVVPNRTEGCWHCFMKALKDGKIPTPNLDPNGSVQPIGCSDPTFTGASFDSNVIATGGVRLAMATLLSNKEKSYPNFDWDVAIINLRDHSGKLTTPNWKTYPLKQAPSCKCNKHS